MFLPDFYDSSPTKIINLLKNIINKIKIRDLDTSKKNTYNFIFIHELLMEMTDIFFYLNSGSNNNIIMKNDIYMFV